MPKRRIKQAYLEFFEKLSFFVEKTSTFISRFCTINRLHLEYNFVIKLHFSEAVIDHKLTDSEPLISTK